MTNNKIHWDDIYTVVINLTKESGRRIFMEKQLNKLSIPHVFLNATDGYSYDFNDTYNESNAIIKNGKPLTSPEKGCALSHRRALEEFLISEKPYGLIMEDDIDIDPSFPTGVITSVNNNKKWTYLQFNYGPVGWQGIFLWWFLVLKSKQKYTILKLIVLFIKAIASNSISILWGIRDEWYRLKKTNKICPIIRDQYLAGCYLITRESAQTLINLNTPLTYTADRIQNIARRNGSIKHFVYVPRIVRQKREMFTSSINNDHFGKEVISY